MFNLKFVRENLILECPKFETYFLKKISEEVVVASWRLQLSR